MERKPIYRAGKREVEAEVVGRDPILDLFQRSHGWDLLMDQMWGK